MHIQFKVMMMHEVQLMGFVTNNLFPPGLTSPPTSQPVGGKALTPIGAAEVLGGFVLAAGLHA